MRLAAAFLLIALPLLGQGFGKLATNRDGSILYFSSSARMKGTDQYLHPKIFVWESAEGVRLFEQRPSDVPIPAPFPGGVGKQFFSLVAPDVSSDGSTVAVTGARFCNFSDVCATYLELYLLPSRDRPRLLIPRPYQPHLRTP